MRPAGILPVIEGTGAVCAVGRGVPQIHAAVRTGISGSRASSIRDRFLEPITMALVPDHELEPLSEDVELRRCSSRLQRMLRLAGPAVREAMGVVPEDASVSTRPVAPALFLGLPEQHPDDPPISDADVLSAVANQAGERIDLGKSRVFARGRAAALLALEAGVRFLKEGRAPAVLVGGVDTYLDLKLLAELDAEERILGPRVTDGFVPGEGAGFLRLRAFSPPSNGPPISEIAVLAVGTATDPGHRYSTEPARGEGLSRAMEAMFAALPDASGRVHSVLAGFNGESFQSKEWGVARLRHTDRFLPAARIDHPADCYGDVGAASGALLLALSHAAMIRRNRLGPTLVFAASDREPRASALLQVIE